MNTLNKIFFAAIVLLVGAVWYQHTLIEKDEKKIHDYEEQKDLGHGITRSSHSTVNSGSLNDYAADAGVKIDTIRDDASNHGAVLTGVNITNTHTDGHKVIGARSSRVTPRPDADNGNNKPVGQDSPASIANGSEYPRCQDPQEKCKPCPVSTRNKYELAEQEIDLEEKTGEERINVGSVSFKAWSDEPWSYSLLPRSFKTASVVAEDDDGKKLIYTKSTMTVGDKTVDLPVSTSDFLETPKPARFRWTPRLSLNAGFGISNEIDFEFHAGASLFLANYGPMKLTPDWNFLGIGASYSRLNTIAIEFSPINYRIAKHIALIDNTYIGPSIGYGAGDRFTFTVTLFANL